MMIKPKLYQGQMESLRSHTQYYTTNSKYTRFELPLSPYQTQPNPAQTDPAPRLEKRNRISKRKTMKDTWTTELGNE